MYFNSILFHSQDRGTIDVRLTDVDKVLINWKAYTKMRSGTQAFVTQMTKMVGTEPLESSHGDLSLLPTYMVWHNLLQSMPVSCYMHVHVHAHAHAHVHVHVHVLID